MKNKRLLFSAILLVFSLALNSCQMLDLYLQDPSITPDEAIVYSLINRLLQSIENDDRKAFSELFSIEARRNATNFDNAIDELFAYYNEPHESIEIDYGPEICSSRDYDHYISNYYFGTEIKTTTKIYHFCVEYRRIDTYETERIGIWCLYVSQDPDSIDMCFGDGGDNLPGVIIKD